MLGCRVGIIGSSQIVTPPASYLIHFDSSVANTVFKDAAGTQAATNDGDVVKSWHTTSSSTKSILAVQYLTTNALLTTVGGKKAVDFNGNSAMTYTTNAYVGLNNATMIVAFQMPLGGVSGNLGGMPHQAVKSFTAAHLPYISQYSAFESWFAGNYPSDDYGVEYTSAFAWPYGSVFVYACKTDSTNTKCYIYTDTLHLVATLTYSPFMKNGGEGNAYAWGEVPYTSRNQFKAMELRVFNTTLSDADLTSNMSAMKTKWT